MFYTSVLLSGSLIFWLRTRGPRSSKPSHKWQWTGILIKSMKKTCDPTASPLRTTTLCDPMSISWTNLERFKHLISFAKYPKNRANFYFNGSHTGWQIDIRCREEASPYKVSSKSVKWLWKRNKFHFRSSFSNGRWSYLKTEQFVQTWMKCLIDHFCQILSRSVWRFWRRHFKVFPILVILSILDRA